MKNTAAAVRQKLINRGLNLLSYRPQSIAEFTTKLKRSGADQITINQVVDHFINEGRLDDFQFAKWWVDQRIKFRPRGNIALKQELSQKGVSQDIIDDVLLSYEDELQLAKSLPSNKRLSRGFSYRVIDALAADE
ncbi:MAG: regulatory protein RecX [Candidatus Beckwithbacteria bacterium]|nr:regulatory protein RecX [Candidatus Beckwithbacteria bacterium]